MFSESNMCCNKGFVFCVDFHGCIGFSMHSTSIVSLAGSRQDRCVPWITGSGSSRSKLLFILLQAVQSIQNDSMLEIHYNKRGREDEKGQRGARVWLRICSRIKKMFLLLISIQFVVF